MPQTHALFPAHTGNVLLKLTASSIHSDTAHNGKVRVRGGIECRKVLDGDLAVQGAVEVIAALRVMFRVRVGEVWILRGGRGGSLWTI